MRPVQRFLFCLALSLPAASTFVSTDARASVMIAVTWDALLKDASSVALVTPVEARSVWEDGRIYTYTRVRVDNGVAGELGTGAETFVRTLGGVVGKIGQVVDGEPVLTVGRQSLLFLHPGPLGSTEVSARAQGQFAITFDENKQPKLVRSSGVGVLFPPKAGLAVDPTKGNLSGQSIATTPVSHSPGPLAGEMLHNKPLADGIRDIAAAWKRAHGK
jgi:hypothetical protein